jgi:hypothetical protein
MTMQSAVSENDEQFDDSAFSLESCQLLALSVCISCPYDSVSGAMSLHAIERQSLAGLFSLGCFASRVQAFDSTIPSRR